jgi:pimeloyl-ACP methyl ester carboxylesterase
MAAAPFEVAWDEGEVGRLLDRVRAYEFPQAPAGSGWTFGCDERFLRDLCAYWVDGYDWRAAVRVLNRYPQATARVDGFDLHFVHVVGEAQGRRPLILSHGWPGSHFEFWDVIEKLAFPSRHGGRVEDAFDLVIPSLPGFGFSEKPRRLVDQRETARLFDRLMAEVLGYQQYLAQGGDWGALVTAMLGLEHADHARAIHMTMLLPRPAAAPETEAEKRWAEAMQPIEQTLGGYRHLQSSKPQSLAWAMAGNPVGQAAWIIERYHDWADLRERPFEAVFTRDQLLTTVMIYLMTGAFTTSVWYYAAAWEGGTRTLKSGQRVEAPTAFALFADPLHPRPPRSFAEKGYAVSRWTEMPQGGHFAALEVPELLVEDVRAWARETG